MQILKGHGSQQTVYTVAFSPDGSILAAWEENGSIATRRLD